MKVLYYDCFSGISGDMNLAAMIDLGVDPEYLRMELNKLDLGGYTIRVSRDERQAISGTRVDVELEEAAHHHHHDHHAGHDAADDHTHNHNDGGHHHAFHEHDASHDHHSHSQAGQGDQRHHVHRNLSDIQAIVEGSTLNQNVKHISMKMFRLIAGAEARVHGTTIDRIHFHEVGAVDSIVDIVGAAICLDQLQVERILCSSVELGGGFVKCAHGLMPVPAPATLEILKNIPVKKGAVDKETTTPTGAAILAANVDEFTDRPRMKVDKIGYGIGHRKMDIPNILRLYLGTMEQDEPAGDYQTKPGVEISCNIDDMNPEHYEHVMEQLFSAGADEVYITPVMMKKNRPASRLNVLCKPGVEKEIIRTLFHQTTTLGLRRVRMEKDELKRKTEKKQTRYGEVTIKSAFWEGKRLKYKPEYEDCKRIAEKQKISIQEVTRHILEDIGSVE